MDTTTTKTPFVMRLIGALTIDPVTYEEVEADRSATGQAFLGVVLSSVGAGIGARGFGSGSETVPAGAWISAMPSSRNRMVSRRRLSSVVLSFGTRTPP